MASFWDDTPPEDVGGSQYFDETTGEYRNVPGSPGWTGGYTGGGAGSPTDMSAAGTPGSTTDQMSSAMSGTMLDPWNEQFSYAQFDPSGLPAYQQYTPTAFQGPAAFKAPTMEEAMADPGYQFALQQGNKALQAKAAAGGSLLTGGTLKSLLNYGQGAATQQYGNVYNRALGEHQQAYNEAYQPWLASNQTGVSATQTNNSAIGQQRQDALSSWLQNYNQALTGYGIARDNFYANQDRPYNKLLPLLNLGESAAAGTNAAGSQYAGNASGTLAGQQAGEYGTQAANANAAGQVAGANAWANALNNIGQTGVDAATMYAYNGNNGLYNVPRSRNLNQLTTW